MQKLNCIHSQKNNLLIISYILKYTPSSIIRHSTYEICVFSINLDI